MTRRAARAGAGWRGTLAALAAIVISTCCGSSGALAQTEPPVVVPNYWDNKQRADPVPLRGPRVIRFLVDDEFPPFHYADRDGKLVGFSVDLARALCTALEAACTIQARRWDTLLDSLQEGRGDAIIAAMRTTRDIRERFLVTLPWHRSPARFVTRRGANGPALSPEALVGRKVAVVAGSAHEAFLKARFQKAEPQPFPDLGQALDRLKAGDVETVLADGVALAMWLNGEESAGCCAFAGGPYLDPRFFGEGVGIILRKDAADLLRALDRTLALVAERGVYAELYLKHFPVGFY